MQNYEIRIIVIVAIIVIAFFMQKWRVSNFEYKCGKCGAKFDLPAIKAVFSPHVFGSKLVRCPECGKMTWAEYSRRNE